MSLLQVLSITYKEIFMKTLVLCFTILLSHVAFADLKLSCVPSSSYFTGDYMSLTGTLSNDLKTLEFTITDKDQNDDVIAKGQTQRKPYITGIGTSFYYQYNYTVEQNYHSKQLVILLDSPGLNRGFSQIEGLIQFGSPMNNDYQENYIDCDVN